MNKFLKPAFILPLFLTLAFFGYWVIGHYITRHLVWDELVSLKNFVLVDLVTTVTHYPDVNNHLLFNLLNNIYCKLIGVSDIYMAMDSVVTVRLFTLVISLITIFYVYRTADKFYGSTAGFMAAIILITTIPFLNFTMQLRGYTLSMTFMAMSIYYLWSFEKKSSWFYALAGVFSVFGLLYAIPSNIYFVLALGLVYFGKWILFIRSKGKDDSGDSVLKKFFLQKEFYILLIVGIGAALAFLAYLPILEDLLNERHLQELKGKSFYDHTLTKVIPFVLHYILSYRFLLLIPVIFSIGFAFKALKKKSLSEDDYRFIFLLLIIGVSFIISLVRGDKPHQRTFTPLASVFAIMVGGSTYRYLKDFKFLKERELISYLLVFVYSVATFFYCDNLREDTLHKAIIGGKKTYNMFYNFYQSSEYDLTDLDILIEEVKRTNYPILLAKEIDRVAEGEYLSKNGLTYYSTVWSKRSPAENDAGFQYQVLLEISQGMGKDPGYQRIAYPPNIPEESGMFVPLFSFLYTQKIIDQQNPKCYVLTFAPRWFENVMRTSLPDLKYKKLNRKSSYHNIYLVSRGS